MHRDRVQFVITAFPMAPSLGSHLPGRNFQSMLPGFRFLFSAIVLCISILVFGLGAAALFRAAHEEFASRPSWRSVPGTMLAQQNEPFAQQDDSSRAVLALLDVEPDDRATVSDTSQAGSQVGTQGSTQGSAREAGLQPSASEATVPPTQPAADDLVDTPGPTALGTPEPDASAAASETASNTATTPEPATMAHLEPGISPPDGSTEAERATPPAAASEPAPLVASPAEAALKLVELVEPSTAASAPISAPAVGPQPAAPAPQIAALRPPEAAGGQAREKEASNETRARAYRNFIKKRLRAQRAANARRRLAHRARIVHRAAVQQRPATTFTGLPAATTAPVMTNVPAAENPYRF